MFEKVTYEDAEQESIIKTNNNEDTFCFLVIFKILLILYLDTHDFCFVVDRQTVTKALFVPLLSLNILGHLERKTITKTISILYQA